MKTFIPFFTFSLLCLYPTSWLENSKNLVSNGDFERGNKNFKTDYSIGRGGEWGTLSNAGTYLITNNPRNAHDHYAPCNDQTAGSGVKMMVANGAMTPNTNVWYQNISVKPRTVYKFEMWATATVENAPAVLQVKFNDALSNSKIQVSTLACSWKKYSVLWYSNKNTSLKLSIQNLVLLDDGNDFAIDNIALYPTRSIFANTSPNDEIVNDGD